MNTKFACLLVGVALVHGALAGGVTTEKLQWDAESKDAALASGETSAAYTFNATNVSSSDVMINALYTSCGCTVAQLPTTPYKVSPGSNVAINVTLNVAGKSGEVTKTVRVDSSAGMKLLLVRANVPVETKK